jgi:hypothetical protein
MANLGYIYILINPSIAGLVKIGKTTRDPEERARELSQATGVATPFTVAYTVAFADCDLAERSFHSVLELNGFRLTSSREFFQVPLQRAIDLLLDVKQRFASTEQLPREVSDIEPFGLDVPDQHLAYCVYVSAIAAWFGLGDSIQDSEEALQLLKKAATLDFPAAYTALAEYYSEQHDPPDIPAAMSYLKQGATRGHARCFVAMADLFRRQGSMDNFAKCWRKYFNSETFLRDDDRKWTSGLEAIRHGLRPFARTQVGHGSTIYKSTWIKLRIWRLCLLPTYARCCSRSEMSYFAISPVRSLTGVGSDLRIVRS